VSAREALYTAEEARHQQVLACLRLLDEFPEHPPALAPGWEGYTSGSAELSDTELQRQFAESLPALPLGFVRRWEMHHAQLMVLVVLLVLPAVLIDPHVVIPDLTLVIGERPDKVTRAQKIIVSVNMMMTPHDAFNMTQGALIGAIES